MLRILLIVLAINFLIVLFILASRKPSGEKSFWSAILLGIPLLGLAIYYLLGRNKKTGPSSFDEWSKK